MRRGVGRMRVAATTRPEYREQREGTDHAARVSEPRGTGSTRMRVSRALAAGVMVIAITSVAVSHAKADPVAVELAPDGVPAWQAATVARALAPELANDRFH